MRRRSFDVIRVFRAAGQRSRGWLVAGPMRFPCALGSGGPVFHKREGDGGTPAASMRVLGIRYRPDRARRPRTGLPVHAIARDDGWCDDPRSPAYNRPVVLPFAASHERLWREDALYDLVVDLGWNRGPIRSGRGSAIFLHSARPGLAPTEGCIAVHRAVLPRLLERMGPLTRIVVVA